MGSSRIPVAILYDFDKTLCTKDMQEYTYIPNIGMKVQHESAQTWQQTRGYFQQTQR